MAEKSRSRVVIWTIIGIAVVAAVVFLIVARRGSAPRGREITVEDVRPFVERIQGQLDREVKRVSRRQSEYGSAYAEEFAQIQTHFNNVNAGIDEIQELTDAAEIEKKMAEIKDELGKARDIRKMIGD